MSNLIQIIKKAAIEAVEASNPMKIFYGTVVSTAPKIKIDQKFTIPKEFLVLTSNVKQNNPLNVGDKVILLQEQGGQKYIVLDKVGD